MRFLLIVLGVVAAFGLTYRMWPAAAPGLAPSNQADARKAQEAARARGPLEVHLDELKQEPPSEKGDTTRNPFRFYVKPPPPPPPKPVTPPPVVHVPVPGDSDYRPPPPPPITIRFIGTLEQGKTKVAVFTDGKGQPVYASEGQTVMGQYKLLKIGVESVTMSYLDGKGVQQIPMRDK